MIAYLHRFIKNSQKSYAKKYGIISLEEHQDAVQCIGTILQREHLLHNQSDINLKSLTPFVDDMGEDWFALIYRIRLNILYCYPKIKLHTC